MRHRAYTLVLALCISAESVCAQKAFPAISSRSFASGSIKVTVTGTFSYSTDIAINKQASFGDGEMTWLQFGVSGSVEPEAAITYNAGQDEVGIMVARGKSVATGGIMTGEKSACSGKVEVTAKLVAGQYTCRELTSYDPGTGKMGKVNVEVRFTAGS